MFLQVFDVLVHQVRLTAAGRSGDEDVPTSFEKCEGVFLGHLVNEAIGYKLAAVSLSIPEKSTGKFHRLDNFVF